jgi:hypothetical protein
MGRSVLAPLLVAALLVAPAILLQTAESQRAYLWHYTFYVAARDFVRYNFDFCEGCGVTVVFYVYEGDSMSSSDIIFRIVAPDGREVYPRTKVSGRFSYSFIAALGGSYVLEFDNTYSILAYKRVDLAVASVYPPETVTITSYFLTTLTRTVITATPVTTYTITTISTVAAVYIPTTTTTTVIQVTTATVTTPTLIPVTLIVTSPVTTTQTVERTVPTPVPTTIPVTQTVEKLVLTPVERTHTAVQTVTERVADITMLVAVAASLLALGVVLGYVLRGAKR